MKKNSAASRSASLIDHLVHLSGMRKRDDLLGGMTLALLETLGAKKVEVFSLVHDENKRFWLPLTQALEARTSASCRTPCVQSTT